MKKKASKKTTSPKTHAPCACGEVPTDLVVAMQPGSKRGVVQGNCCGLWSIEFFAGYPKSDAEAVEKANQAWNDAPRVA